MNSVQDYSNAAHQVIGEGLAFYSHVESMCITALIQYEGRKAGKCGQVFAFWGIDFSSDPTFFNGFWNCSGSVFVFFRLLHYLTNVYIRIFVFLSVRY